MNLNKNELELLKKIKKLKQIDDLKIKSRFIIPKKLKPFFEPMRYKFAWGGRVGAKTHSACKALLYQANKKKLRILCCRETLNSISESVHAELSDIARDLYAEEFDIRENKIIHKKTDSRIFYAGLRELVKSQSIKSCSNVDICLVEEASAVSEESIRILVKTIRKEKSEIWFLFNRVLLEDPVWKFKNKVAENRKFEMYTTILDNPFAPDTAIAEYKEDKANYEKIKNDWFLHDWLGEPRGDDEAALITVSEVYGAAERKQKAEGGIEIGVDVAREGKNKTVFYKRKGLVIIDKKEYDKNTIDECVYEIEKFVDFDQNVLIKVDDSGVGGGVTDYLRRYKYNVVGIKNGEKAFRNDLYYNRITEMWFHMKEIINDISIPDIPLLKLQLSTRRWSWDEKRGVRKIESKDKYIERMKKIYKNFDSPDDVDALILCFAKCPVIYKPIEHNVI